VIRIVISVRCFFGPLLNSFDLINFLSGYAIFFVCPAAEID
jgi:hypothetical protein